VAGILRHGSTSCVEVVEKGERLLYAGAACCFKRCFGAPACHPDQARIVGRRVQPSEATAIAVITHTIAGPLGRSVSVEVSSPSM